MRKREKVGKRVFSGSGHPKVRYEWDMPSPRYAVWAEAPSESRKVSFILVRDV